MMSGEAARSALPALERLTQATAQTVGPAFDAAGVGFAFLAFEREGGAWTGFVTNVERPELAAALRRIAERVEREDPPWRS